VEYTTEYGMSMSEVWLQGSRQARWRPEDVSKMRWIKYTWAVGQMALVASKSGSRAKMKIWKTRVIRCLSYQPSYPICTTLETYSDRVICKIRIPLHTCGIFFLSNMTQNLRERYAIDTNPKGFRLCFVPFSTLHCGPSSA